jgi:RHS repeat-associated protein
MRLVAQYLGYAFARSLLSAHPRCVNCKDHYNKYSFWIRFAMLKIHRIQDHSTGHCNNFSAIRNHITSVFVALFLIAMAFSSPTIAQSVKFTNNTADQSLRGGLEIDPSTLAMTFRLPLAEYPGRGVNLPVTLSYNSKVWRMELKRSNLILSAGVDAKFAEHSTVGWTSSLDVPVIEYIGSTQPFTNTGSPICTICIPEETDTRYYIDRLLVHMPQGSTHELRKNDTPVLALSLTGMYYAVDGSRLRYDADNAILYLPDGSRYLLNAPGGVQYIDRNGNTLSFNSSSKHWTDTLGRVINQPPMNNSAPGDYVYFYPGAGGTARHYTFRWRHLADVRTDPSQPLRYTGDYDPSIGGVSPSLFNGQGCGCSGQVVFSYLQALFNPIVLWQIALPNGGTYTFTYNIYGEIDKVQLPSGGYERFEYAAVPGLSYLGFADDGLYSQANRGVVKHWISATGSGSDEVLWQYSAFANAFSSPTVFKTTIIGPDNVRAERYLHHAPVGLNAGKFGFNDPRAGMVQEERIYAASGQMIRRTLFNWTTDLAQLPPPFQFATARRNPRPTKKVEILLDTGGSALVATTATQYDADLNETAVEYHDYVSADSAAAQTADISAFALGALLRSEEKTYLVSDSAIPAVTQQAYRDRNLIGLVSKSVVKKAPATSDADIIDATEYKFDESAYAPLPISGPVPGWNDPGATTPRGTVTTLRRWLNRDSNNNPTTYPNGQWIETHAQTDQCGNPRFSWDANGNMSEIRYNDSFSDTSKNSLNTNAFATRTRSPIPDPSGVKGSNTELETATIYEYWTGSVISSTDANLNTTSYEYEPPIALGFNSLNRPLRVTRPDGGVTEYEYGDTPGGFYVKSRTKQNSTTWIEDFSYMDGLARVFRTSHKEAGNQWSIKDTQYDYKGRVLKASNPYINSVSNPSTPSGLVWTETTYDSLNRVLTVTTPDGAVLTTNYSGNNVTATDQAGKVKRTELDALGRMVKVIEDPLGLNYATLYEYNALNKLTKVTQGAQIRTFVYDSLARLTSAASPEAGVVLHKYDNNSNLIEKTDARNITTNYTYDALDRNTTVDYLNTTVNPDITRFYDNPNPGKNGKGRFWHDYAGGTHSTGQEVEHNAIDSYDSLGRPLAKRQHFKKNGVWSGAYSISHTYDLAGNLKTLTYPSNHTVDYSYDQAGRLSVFSGNLGGSSRTYTDTISYNAAGQMIKERFGTNTSLYHNSHYNNRQQLVSTRVGDSATDEWNWSRGAIGFYYGTTAVNTGDIFANDTDNNGNLRRQINFVPLAGGDHVIPQQDDYSYDGLNRISSFTEAQRNSGGQWTLNVAWQNFSYDRWGNRQITGASGGVSNYNPVYDQTTNRISGLGYDAAGNITFDPLSGGTMTYDAESRLLTVTSGGGGSYVYNADGNRVRRITAGQETWYVYGCGGELLAEYESGAQPAAPLKEYGYRGEQLLIIAESGSGGGTSFVKPALKLSDDLIGKARLEVDDNTDGLFVADEPFDDLEFNEDPGSATAGVSSENNTGTHIDGVTGTTAEEFGNAQSFNGTGGELLAEHPIAALGAPQKGYAYRGGRSIITAQGGVVTLNPSVNQSPDPGQGGTLAVTDILNAGHGNTPTGVSASDFQSQPSKNITQTRSARWSSFQSAPSGVIIGLKLKFNWAASGNVDASVEVGGSASARIDFDIYYSIDGGSSWTNALSRFRVASQSGEGSNGDSISDGGSVEVVLSPSQDISLVQVRDFMKANAVANAPGHVSEAFAQSSAGITTSVSSIRLEVEMDTTAPVISNVAAGGITASSATITWTTNENSDSQVEYGPTTAYGQSTTLNPALVTAHSQGLSGLASGTLYHYRVRSRDAGGNLAVSGDFTFTTPDTTPPVISNVAAGGITASGATITWNTNENSDSQVEYGPTAAYGQSTTHNPALVTAHSQGISGLTSGTLYHYRVKSRDAAGNLAVSGDHTFTTTAAPDTTPPTVTSFSPAAGATNVSANVNVAVTFSEAMDAATVNGATVELRDPSNTLVSATVSYNSASFTAILDPTAPLTVGVTYTARVMGGGTDPRIKDVAGNALAADVSWTFTTAQSGSNGIKWMVTDHLGSTRMVIDEAGSLAGIKRHDFAPFGEELGAVVGIRSASIGYSSDSARQKFTGYERDDESGLDFAQSRYYANVQGRFTSPDPLLASGLVTEPQSWNRYIYVGNRPTVITDPTGLLWYIQLTDAGNYEVRWWDYNPGGKWKEIQMDLSRVYRAVNGHLIILNKNSKRWIDLTAEAMRVENIRKMELAKERAEQYVNAILINFITLSIEGGLAIGTAGASEGVLISGRVLLTAAKEYFKDSAKDAVEELVVGKFVEAVTSCFAAGTPVWTQEGLKPIEEIQAGDVALSWNEEAMYVEYKRVAQTFVRQADGVLEVAIEGEASSLRVTTEHPFFVRRECSDLDGEWVEAVKLSPGDQVKRPNGKWAQVRRIVWQAGKVTVYNFEVADNHNYFVGNLGTLVHNDCNDDALKAEANNKGGKFYSLMGSEGYTGDDGIKRLRDAPAVDTSSGIYGGDTFNNHTVYVKDGKVYDKMGGANGMPYREWAAQVGLGKEGGIKNILRRIPRSKVLAGRSGR